MANELFKLVSSGDIRKIRQMLSENPALANEGLSLREEDSAPKGHPLHRVCDAVFAKRITDEQAIDIAEIFLEFGANIDGYKLLGDNNTPLIAAASLHAEQLGIFYIEKGADIFYVDKIDGATALHWAAFCGRDQLVKKLIEAGAKVNQMDTTYKSIPVGWAIHTLTSGDNDNMYHQLDCIKLLRMAGTDKRLLDPDSLLLLDSMAKNDEVLKQLIHNHH